MGFSNQDMSGGGMVVGCLSDGSREKGVEWSNGLIALFAAMLSHKIGAVMQSSSAVGVKAVNRYVCATREVSSRQCYGRNGGRTEVMGSGRYKTVTAASKSLFSSLLSPSSSFTTTAIAAIHARP
jgi:hypothetical protein